MDQKELNKVSFLVLRLLGSLIFIAAGLNHLFQTAGATARLESAELGYLATWLVPTETLILLSGVGLLAGGLLLLLGYQTRLAALLLLAILIPITLTIQMGSAGGSGPLFKNFALIGLLLFFTVNGAVYYGLDQIRKGKTKPSARKRNANTNRSLAAVGAGLLLVLGSCTSGTMAAQSPAGLNTATAAAQKNYAVLISQPNHLKAAVNTAETITPNSRYNRSNFVVMACAKSVEAFVQGSELEPEFKRGQAAGVTYKVCGMSLKQFNIDPATLLEGIGIIPNGLTYMFDLKQQGYITVEL